jgi:DNA modification methylase
MLSWIDLQALYKGILKEAHRVLGNKGVLIFKCQDYTDSSSTMTHALVYNWATEIGFYAKDLAILVKPNKVTNPNTKQRHLRKIHTYFWVFQKK